MLYVGVRFIVRGLKLAAILLSLVQLLVFLPLSLEHSQQTFLTFSALLSAFYFGLSTLRWATYHTRLAWIARIPMVLQNLFIPVALFLCAKLYAPDTPNALTAKSVPWMQSVSNAQAWLASHSPISWLGAYEPRMRLDGFDQILALFLRAGHYFVSRVPGWWYGFLLHMSPVFSLLEGVASLLVVQAVARFSNWLYVQHTDARIHDPHGNRTSKMSSSVLIRKLLQLGLDATEAWQLVFLLLSATVYVTSAVGLYVSFEGASQGRSLTAAAIGACVTSTMWISGLALAFRKANIFAYVVFNVYQLSTSLLLGADPLHLLQAFRESNMLSLPLHGSAGANVSRLLRALESGWRVISVALDTLPPTVIVNLVYRMTVLYLATRVLAMLAWQSRYQDCSVHTLHRVPSLQEQADSQKLSEIMLSAKEPCSDDENEMEDVAASSVPEVGLDEKPERDDSVEPKPEPRAPALGMVLVRYSRFLLITVYSHLLLLDQNHQTYWRMLAVSFTLGLWGVELLLGKEDSVMYE